MILGLDNAGKTTVVRQLLGAPIDEIEPTLGFTIQTLHHQAGYDLHLWDVGGQKSLRAYWRNYFEATDGLVWVVDATDARRLDDARIALQSLLQQERLAGATLLVFCNKQDAVGALTVQQVAERLQLNKDQNELLQKRHWQVLACSAVTGQGLADGIDWMVQDIASRIFLLG